MTQPLPGAHWKPTENAIKNQINLVVFSKYTTRLTTTDSKSFNYRYIN